MQMTFRWFGDTKDTVSLEQIRQIPGVKGIVPALHTLPAGEVWPLDMVMDMKHEIEAAGLTMECIESVNVHEDIKLGNENADKYIDNYIESIRNLGKAGVRVICYNFMPVFDWTRTQLDKEAADGSTSLVYYKDQLEKMDPLTGELNLPGWDASYTKESLAAVFAEYARITEEDLWKNLQYFLEAVIPVAEESGINMAIHPDDPPWPIFGLPRIITCEKNLDRFLKLVDSPANGLTFCTGSLGSSADNDIPHMVEKYAAMGRIHFMHIRNVKLLPDGSFEESGHLSANGSLDIVAIMKALHKNGFDGYVRPDHGRMIWGETGKPGYGLYDRALGAAYLNGIWEALEKSE